MVATAVPLSALEDASIALQMAKETLVKVQDADDPYPCCPTDESSLAYSIRLVEDAIARIKKEPQESSLAFPFKTIDELRSYFGNGEISDEELADLLESMGEDPGEGVEWLPFYKLAMAIKVGIIGLLIGAIDTMIEAKRGGVEYNSDRLRSLIARVAEEMRLSLITVGRGPGPEEPTQDVDRVVAAILEVALRA